MSVREGGGSNPGQPRLTRRRLVAGEARDGGGGRDSPSDDQKSGGGALRDAQTRAHLTGRTGEAKVAGGDGNRDDGGGRSSGTCGFGVVVLGRRSWWDLRAPGRAPSALTHSGTGCGGCGHGHAMAGGEKLSAAVGDGARGRERRGRARGKAQELTASSRGQSAGSGKRRQRRIDDGDLRCPRKKKMMAPALRGFRRAVGRWGGRRGSRRSSQAQRGVEGETVCAVVLVGGGGSVRGGGETERGRAFGEERGSSEGVPGGRGSVERMTRGVAVSR